MKIVRTKPGRSLLRRTDARRAERRRNILGWLILAAGTALLLLLAALLCRPLARLAADPQRLKALVRAQGRFGYLAFLGIEILQGFLPIPLELTAVAGGYIFGRAAGFLLSLCSVPISSAAIFLFTRLFGHRLVDFFVTPAHQSRARWFRSERARGLVTFFVFLIPGTPKRLFVFTAGLAPQSLWRFLLISTAARVPALLACSFGGGALGTGNYSLAAFLLTLFCVLAAAGFLFYRKTVPARRRP